MANPWENPSPNYADPTKSIWGAWNPTAQTLAGAPEPAPAAGLFQPPSWIENPEEAAIRAMRNVGMNPASFNPFSQAVLRNAKNLAYTLLGRQVGVGANESVNRLVDNDYMLGQLGGLIQEAGRGGQVLGGFQPRQAFDTISRAVAESNRGTMQPGVNWLSSYFNNPNQAIDYASSVLYGGLNPRYQQAVTAPFLNLRDYYAGLLEREPGTQQTILDVLTGTAQPNYGRYIVGGYDQPGWNAAARWR